MLRKIQSFSDPRLYALSVVAENLAKCTQPLVPERVFMAGGTGRWTGGDGQADRRRGRRQGLLGLLLNLLVAEKSGFQLTETSAGSELEAFSEKVTRQAMDAIEQAVLATQRYDFGSPRQRRGPATAAKTVVSSSRIENGRSTHSHVDGALIELRHNRNRGRVSTRPQRRAHPVWARRISNPGLHDRPSCRGHPGRSGFTSSQQIPPVIETIANMKSTRSQRLGVSIEDHPDGLRTEHMRRSFRTY